MTGLRQVWLVAVRELRERSRSRGFRVSLGILAVTVAVMIVLPAVLLGAGRTSDVGLTGATPRDLGTTVQEQASAVGVTAQLHAYASRAAGEDAVRSGAVDVLVVDGRELDWPRNADDRLKAIVTGAIQVVAIRDRAAAAGIGAAELSALMAPVSVANVELSAVAGRTSGDETATVAMTGLLLAVISVYGGLVLTGVVEEKTSRVVEVLVARIPPRSLLAGKVIGIGLLGFGQVAVTAAAALIAITAVGSLDIPAIRTAVIVWLVVWFIVGYALYAMVFGALGALASRPEDAQSAVAPAMVLMVASYFAAFLLIAQPDSVAARVVSFFPTSAPLAMPSRLALGSPAWWEPVVAVVIAVAAIAGLARLGGRLYATAILHGGASLSLRDAWRSSRVATRGTEPSGRATREARRFATWTASITRSKDMTNRATVTALMAIGVALGVVVGTLTRDVIVGVIAGAGFIALTVQTVNLWTGRGGTARPAGGGR